MFLEDKDKITEGPFDGVLIIVNLPHNNMPISDHVEKISENIQQAHADGFAVVYAYEDSLGTQPVPDYLPTADGFDFVSLLGEKEAILPLLPKDRKKLFYNIAKKIFDDERFCFDRKKARILGFFNLLTKSVFVPMTLVEK